MSKIVTIQEQLMLFIYRLLQKKTSKLFQKPVDILAVPDYYQKIKHPIDISTIIKKLREGQYKFATQVNNDFQLMMQNCRHYNALNNEVMKQAQKFSQSIKTEWGNFLKNIQKKDVFIDKDLVINQQIIAIYDKIQDKFINKKPTNMQNVLGQLEQNKKPSAQLKILPPLPSQLFIIQNKQQLPSHLGYYPLKYSAMRLQDKKNIFNTSVNRQQLSILFQQISHKKLIKYKKILYQKVMWIQNKIIKKCLLRKRFKKMQSTQYLSQYIQNGKIATNLQLRHLQMYVKMVAYWILNYPQILSHYMQNKFIQTCKAIKKGIFRVLRYRKLARSTRIQVDLQNQAKQPQNGDQLIGQQQSRKFDNQIKSFKRMLVKDESQTIKKHTKFQIKIQNGECVFVDWNFQSIDKKKNNRTNINSRTIDTAREQERMQRQKRRKEQKQQDQIFLKEYLPVPAQQIINKYANLLVFDWQQLILKKLPTTIELNFEKQQMIV